MRHPQRLIRLNRLYELHDRVIPPASLRLLRALLASRGSQLELLPLRPTRTVYVSRLIRGMTGRVQFERWLRDRARPGDMVAVWRESLMLIHWIGKDDDELRYRTMIERVEADPTPFGLAQEAMLWWAMG